MRDPTPEEIEIVRNYQARQDRLRVIALAESYVKKYGNDGKELLFMGHKVELSWSVLAMLGLCYKNSFDITSMHQRMRPHNGDQAPIVMDAENANRANRG
jgi:hypothetical protein